MSGQSPPRTLRTDDGHTFTLGKRLGGGGEGEVFLAGPSGDLAVKLYKNPRRPRLEAKIRAMVQAGLAAQSELAAFPWAVMLGNDGLFAGFLMRAVRDRLPLHEVYAPAARKQHFPTADYGFLAHTATNIARAVASVHLTGCVIGDVNASGMLVDHQATVALVDADSFQFVTATQKFPCLVGTPEYTPPELQGRSLEGITRTPNHDNFGLAVLIFQTLMMGHHPFNGVYSSSVQNPPPISKRIEQLHYPHPIPEPNHPTAWDWLHAHNASLSREGSSTRPGSPHHTSGTGTGSTDTGQQRPTTARRVPVTPPPGLPSLVELSPVLAALFAQALNTRGDAERPTAQQWVEALEAFEASLYVCPEDEHHLYPGHLNSCPWCQMEVQSGTPLFPGRPPAPIPPELAEALQQKPYEQTTRPTGRHTGPSMGSMPRTGGTPHTGGSSASRGSISAGRGSAGAGNATTRRSPPPPAGTKRTAGAPRPSGRRVPMYAAGHASQAQTYNPRSVPQSYGGGGGPFGRLWRGITQTGRGILTLVRLVALAALIVIIILLVIGMFFGTPDTDTDTNKPAVTHSNRQRNSGNGTGNANGGHNRNASPTSSNGASSGSGGKPAATSRNGGTDAGASGSTGSGAGNRTAGSETGNDRTNATSRSGTSNTTAHGSPARGAGSSTGSGASSGAGTGARPGPEAAETRTGAGNGNGRAAGERPSTSRANREAQAPGRENADISGRVAPHTPATGRGTGTGAGTGSGSGSGSGRGSYSPSDSRNAAGTSATPEGSATSGAPGTSGRSAASDSAGTPGRLGNQGATGTPARSGTPEASGTAGRSGSPDTSSTSGRQGSPAAPGASNTPGTPGAAGNKGGTPAPDASGTQNSAITNRVLYMQRTLRQYGYAVPESGNFDRTTRAHAAEFLYNATGLPVRENQSVQEFYRAFQRVQGENPWQQDEGGKSGSGETP